jgi:hypothetical protein
MSADGAKIIACLSVQTNSAWQSSVFLSTNYGAAWTQMDLPVMTGFPPYKVACSADGSKLLAAVNGGSVYFSTNIGASWQTSSVPKMNWVSLASSANGARMVGAVSGGSVLLSTNYGAAWKFSNLPNQVWASVCISADGNWIGAVGTNTYISSDAGRPLDYEQIQPGRYRLFSHRDELDHPQVYTSTDGGVTWLTNLSSLPSALEYGVAASADFSELVADGGGIWAGRVAPSPHLNIQSRDSAVAISWLIPSTNFVLQQSADLSNPSWTSVPLSPTLNFTNLHQEITVPATTSNAFFRLATP